MSINLADEPVNKQLVILKPKPKTIAELKDALQSIWDDMPQEPIKKSIKDFTKRLKACVQANGGHFEHLM